MVLTPGAHLGPYEILAAIGRGGMGDVYRARDTRLKREVAIKVLPADVTSQAGRRQRFEREAQAVAALGHPHICALFDVGSQDGIEYLVMEYLEGETLDRRLVRGALPLDQVLRHAIEMAAALDHAHRHGIIHRDLKPANVMLTKAGAKLLDFGLAKWSEREPVQLKASAANGSALPETQTLTAQGAILGTLQYMAPEQLESKDTDECTDLFALGAIMYEMATGRRAFAGASHASLIAAILTAEPAPMASLNPLVSAGLERIVRKCLAKDPELRWQTARDLLDELKWIGDSGSLDTLVTPGSGAQQLTIPKRQRGRRAHLAWLAAGAVAVTAVIVTAVFALKPFLSGPTEGPAFQFTVSAPEGWVLNEASPFTALSPDGRSLVFTATSRTGERAVWLRSLDSGATRQIAGSEGGTQPFWSPDSQFIFFRTEQGWRRVDSAGGPGQGIGAVDEASYGTANRDGVVIFMIEQKIAQTPKGLFRISSTLAPTPVTTPDESQKEIAHEWPQFLPDGRHFLYVARAGHPDQDGIVYVGSLESSDRVRLFKADSQAVYAPPGVLVYLRGSTLVAQPFDADALRVTGEPVRIAERVDRDGISRRGAFSVSQTGVLAYHPASETQLVWFDRGGGSLKAIGAGTNPALSPDERQVAVTRREGDGRTSSLWLINLADGNASRFTSGPLSDDMPLWSRDGRHIVFKAMREQGPGIFQRSASGRGAEEAVLAPQGTLPEPAQFGVLQPFIHPLAYSRDGRFLIYAKSRPTASPPNSRQTTLDLWMVPLAGNRNPVPLSQADYQSDSPEWGGQLSPDGRWLAYVSFETGRHEVYVRPFPSGDGHWKISADGGYEPVWRRDGKEIFYLAYDRNLMAVAVKSDTAFDAGTPSRMFRTRVSLPTWAITRNQYAVSADGQRFLIRGVASLPLTVVTNWTAALKN